MNIYVGNIPKTATEKDIRSIFEVHGKVGEVKLIHDKFTNQFRGFGFVEMPSNSEADKAVKNLNGSLLEGNNLIVNEARDRKRNRSRNQRRGGGGHRGW